MDFSPALADSLADARPDVFWTDRPELRPTPRAALTGHGGRADLLVVGGGFTGLWAAIQAKEDDPSRDVVVLEAGRLGVGASGRNGGFVSPSLTHGLAQGVAQWPDEIATLERLAAENFAGWQATLVEHRIDADFHLPGELTLALTEHQVGAVREAYELHLEHGKAVGLLMAAHRVDADEAFELLRSTSQDLNMKLSHVAEQVVRGQESQFGGKARPGRT